MLSTPLSIFKIKSLWSPIPRASLVSQRVKTLPAMQGTQVPSLGWENPLEKEMATHCGILCLGNPMYRGA